MYSCVCLVFEYRYAVWFRIDQKSCLKSLASAGLTPVVIEGRLVGDEIQTNMETLAVEVERLGADNIACVVSTTR